MCGRLRVASRADPIDGGNLPLRFLPEADGQRLSGRGVFPANEPIEASGDTRKMVSRTGIAVQGGWQQGIRPLSYPGPMERLRGKSPVPLAPRRGPGAVPGSSGGGNLCSTDSANWTLVAESGAPIMPAVRANPVYFGTPSSTLVASPGCFAHEQTRGQRALEVVDSLLQVVDTLADLKADLGRARTEDHRTHPREQSALISLSNDLA